MKVDIPSVAKKDAEGNGSVNGRGRYKFWALGTILLLAFWSIYASTVTLKWSGGSLNRLSDDSDSSTGDDLDVLEIEEREKAVKHMWDTYTHSRGVKLPRFWQQAFEAAYEQLESNSPELKEAAVNEIAKMSTRMVDLETPRRKNIAVNVGEVNIKKVDK